MDWGLVLGIGIGLLAAWMGFIAILMVVRPRDLGLRGLVAVVPDVLRLVRDLLADRNTPLGPRLALVGLLLWLLSPIDVIPEFIPVLGPVDDIVVAVLVLRYVCGRLGEPYLRHRWHGTDAAWAALASVVCSRPGGRRPV